MRRGAAIVDRISVHRSESEQSGQISGYPDHHLDIKPTEVEPCSTGPHFAQVDASTTHKHSVRRARNLAKRVSGRIARCPPLIRRVADVIAADVGRQWTLKQLANVVNRSPSYLGVMFHRATGFTVRRYSLLLRMTKAAAELEHGVKVEAVSHLVGFRSRKNFYRQFKAWFGARPGDLQLTTYRREQCSDGNRRR